MTKPRHPISALADGAPKRLLSLAEAGDLAGMSVRTIRRRIAAGALTHYRSGGMVKVLESDVLAMFREEPAWRRAPQTRGLARRCPTCGKGPGS